MMQGQLVRALSRVQTVFGAERKDEPPFVDDPLFVTRGNPAFVEHDKMGFRNARIPRGPALAVVGDSQVYGSRLARDEAWPQLAGIMAKADVYNCAVPGWGGLQYALVMNEVLRLRPKAVLVCPYMGNDIYESFVHARSSDAPLARTLLGDADLNPPLPDSTIHAGTEAALRRAAAENPGLDPAQLLALCSERGVPNFHYARLEKAEFYLTEHSRTPFEDLDQPAVATGFNVLRQALAHARDAALAAGTAFGVMPIPTREYLVWLRRDEATLQNPEALDHHGHTEQRLLDALSDFCRDRNINHFELAPTLARYVGQGAYFQHSLDGHPSPKGARIIANAINLRILPTLRRTQASTLYPLY